MSFVSYAKNFEDVMLRRVFRDVRVGFYVDVGAWEPDINSATRALYDAGWHGINIEPSSAFKRLADRRPRDINLQLALGAQEGRLTLCVHHPDDTVLGTSALQAVPPSEAQRGYLQFQECEIESCTLAQVLDAHAAGQHIHFLKINAEDAALEILLGADWQRHRPELLVINATRPNRPERNDAAWSPLLTAAGYQAVWFDGLNAWFLRKESTARATAFQAPPNIFDDFQVYDHKTAQQLSQAEAWGRSLETVVLSLQEELHRVRTAHEALLAENRVLLEARGRLIHRLEKSDGSRLLRVVLSVFRAFCRLIGRSRTSNLGVPSSALPATTSQTSDARLARSVEDALLTLALRGGRY